MTLITSKADLLALKNDDTTPQTLIFQTQFAPKDMIDLRDYSIRSISYGDQRRQRGYFVFPSDKDFDAGKLHTHHSHIESADMLPQSLELLTYGLYQSRFLDKVPFKMMNQLREITFHDYFHGSIDFEMLPNLELINFGTIYNQELPESFFGLKYLKRVKLVMYTHILPKLCFPQLEELVLSSYDHPIDLTSLTQLRILTLGSISSPIAGRLPHQNLEELQINSCYGGYNHPLDEDFDKFSRLRKLMLGGAFNQPLPASFKNLNQLTSLWFGNVFDQEVDGYLPDSLETLCFAWAFNRQLNCLPAKLQKLSLGHTFNQPLTSLPVDLRELFMSWCYTHSFPKWPSGLEELWILGHCPLDQLVLLDSLRQVVLPSRSSFKNQAELEAKLEEFRVLYPNTHIRFNG